MKTVKAKFVLFSLSAILAASFLTSCEQSELVDLTEPIGNEAPVFRTDVDLSYELSDKSKLTNEVIFNTILEASKGKLTQNDGIYTIELTERDLGTATYNAIRNMEMLVLKEGIHISQSEAMEIFCMRGTNCIVGAYTFSPSEIRFNTLSDGVDSTGLFFELRPGYWVSII